MGNNGHQPMLAARHVESFHARQFGVTHMMRTLMTVSLLAFLTACSGESGSSDEPINNTPAETPGTAPTESDPTPQTGTGGQSPVTGTPTGNENR